MKNCANCTHACLEGGSIGNMYDPPEAPYLVCYSEGATEYLESIGNEDGYLEDGTEAEKCPCYDAPPPVDWSNEWPEDWAKPLTPEEEAELERMKEQSDTAYFISVGYLDPKTLEPTDAYFRASDFAYDAQR